MVYMIFCTTCNLKYMECTIRKFKTSIAEYVYDCGKVKLQGISGAAQHFFLNTLKILGIESVKKTPRGGDWHDRLLKREAYMITMGLNFRSDLLLYF